MQVDYAKEAFILILKFYPLLDGAQVVPYMKFARRPDAAEDAHDLFNISLMKLGVYSAYTSISTGSIMGRLSVLENRNWPMLLLISFFT